MSRLADGRYRCATCKHEFDAPAMRADKVYCRPCSASKKREAYALRMALRGAGKRPRPRFDEPPADFERQAPGRTDDVLSDMYGVSDRTIRNWRNALGLPPTRKWMPDDFASLAKGMTGAEVVARWGVHLGTAYRWLRECGMSGRQGRPPGPQVRPKRVRAKRVATIAPPRPEQPSRRAVQAVQVHTNGCPDCTRDRLCRTHQTAQLNADIEAWMAAGNRPVEVPQGATGLQFGWGRPTA